MTLSLPLLAAFLLAATYCSAWIPAITNPIRPTATRNENSERIYYHLSAIKTDEELLPAVRDGIADKDATDEWNDCIQYLAQDLSLDTQRAEIILASALEWRGWARVTSALARKYMTPKLPNLQQLQTALAWLREGPLALTDLAILQEAIEKSPKAYLVDPEAAYQEALATAPKKYQDPNTFQALMLEDPTVLECSYNCVDDGCASECGNCWVSYEIKRGGQTVEI